MLVFGGNGAPPSIAAVGSGTTGGQQSSAPAGPPPYVGGLDENGNIKHIVQPGDTLGDIALIYGYTWSDLPYMMQLNGLTNVRDLEVGSIFLVPPKDGTYTPTPDNRPPTETPVPTEVPPTITPFIVPSDTPAITATLAIATAGANVAPPVMNDTNPTPDAAVQVVAVATQGEIQPAAAVIQTRSSSATWITLAVAVQVVVLIGAGIEFLRRAMRKRK